MIRFENNDYLLDLTIDTACEILYPEAIQYIMFVSWRKLFLRMPPLIALQVHYVPQLYTDARSIEFYKTWLKKTLITE